MQSCDLRKYPVNRQTFGIIQQLILCRGILRGYFFPLSFLLRFADNVDFHPLRAAKEYAAGPRGKLLFLAAASHRSRQSKLPFLLPNAVSALMNPWMSCSYPSRLSSTSRSVPPVTLKCSVAVLLVPGRECSKAQASLLPPSRCI